MFIQSCKFKRSKESEWEEGIYVGETDNSSKSVILTKDFVPVIEDLFDYASNPGFCFDFLLKSCE